MVAGARPPNTEQARRKEPHSSSFAQHPDSVLDSRLIAKTLAKGENLSRLMGWRMRLLVLAALAGCLTAVLVTRWLSNAPDLPAEWRAGVKGQIELASSNSPLLSALVGRTLVSVSGGGHATENLDSIALQRSARWVTDDRERQRMEALQVQLANALSADSVRLEFSPHWSVEIAPHKQGLASLGAVFWLLLTLALALYLVAMVVLLAKPSLRTLLFAVMSVGQSANLIFMGIESTLVLGYSNPFPSLDWPMRVAFDLATGAALVHMATIHPRPIPMGKPIAFACWLGAGAVGALMAAGWISNLWWWVQGSVVVMGCMVIVMMGWSYRLLQHPFAIMMKRFGIVVVGTWILLTAAAVISDLEHIYSMQQQIAATGSVIWYVFLASLLLLSPFLSKSQQVMREFSLLAATSTVASSLDLLFVAILSFSQFASVTLALFLSLGMYAGARQWILNRVRNRNMLTTERMFEKVYRIAREVEIHPERTPALLSQLLRDLFNPMETLMVQKRTPLVRVVGDGSTLLVPVPELTDQQMQTPTSIVLRFAGRGQRLFSTEDARLTGRIIEQLCRAVAFDKAVEQGRSEERLRLAQDLHDDIGARLLTLMYKAQSPETEDYVRHTLQDLKTLTRGLAAPNHPLSHAAGEWKADLTQRLQAAQLTLGWNLSFDKDISLTVVQWSGLTRVMRELVSNVIAHSHARQVDIEFHLRNDQLVLSVTDDGDGRDPKSWSHGLGLGGVRKRVKQLGGDVEWREATPKGICCAVTIRKLSDQL